MSAEAAAKKPGVPGVGDVIAGKFRVERVLGQGGMGHVLEATHLMLDERVALKFLKAEALLSPDIVARFAQEGRAAAKLKSEHVARVLDVGEERSIPYLVMEYLEGKNLEQLLAERGPLPIQEAVDLIIQACEGISEAHARAIIHRDIKPANLFLAQREGGWPTLKILDFGISKAALSPTSPPLGLGTGPVNTVSLLGSPHYMSPEQLRSTKHVDRRTDVWALGVVLFELLTGTTAFTAGDFISLAQEIFDKPHGALRSLRPDAPEGLEHVIDRALAKSPEARFQSAGELALALLAFTTDKRSRVIATHAVTLTRQAGIDPNLPLPSAAPPANPSSGRISTASGHPSNPVIPAPPRVPGIEGNAPTMVASRMPAPVSAVSQPNLSTASRSESASGTLPTASAAPSKAKFIAVGAVVLVLAGAAFFAMSRPNRVPDPPARTPAETTAEATAKATTDKRPETAPAASTAAVASTPASTTASSAAASASAVSGAKPGAQTPVKSNVTAPKHSTGGASSAASGSDLDIRRER